MIAFFSARIPSAMASASDLDSESPLTGPLTISVIAVFKEERLLMLKIAIAATITTMALNATASLDLIVNRMKNIPRCSLNGRRKTLSRRPIEIRRLPGSRRRFRQARPGPG
ncbi:hypothetical protein M2360_004690 [Rhizobium sp. SG_E_25_P2]|nr:hypothetical protein [Rhizobium sp. SG_E_25_P2]